MDITSFNLAAREEFYSRGNIETESLINIKHAEMLGGDSVEKPKLPPEFLRKIQEVLAVGLARNFIKKASEELQQKGAKSPLVKTENAC